MAKCMRCCRSSEDGATFDAAWEVCDECLAKENEEREAEHNDEADHE